MSFLIPVTEVKNNQSVLLTPIQKLYGYYFINSMRGLDSGSEVVLDGKSLVDIRRVSENISTLETISTRGYIDKLIKNFQIFY